MSATLLASLQILAFLAIALAALVPTARRGVAAWLGLLGALGLGAAARAIGTTNTLPITHRFRAFDEHVIAPRDFPVETASAPGPAWALLAALFCLGWAGWAFCRRDQAAASRASAAFTIPLALAWSGLVLQLGLQKLAAPAALLVPFDLAPDRVLLPASLAAALLLARAPIRLPALGLYLCAFLALSRLPLAVFGTLATRREWGSHLDVHGTTRFVPPAGGSNAGYIEVLPGSNEQLWWLVWAPHLLVLPGLYLLSCGGIAFFVRMLRRQREVDRAATATA